MTDELKCLAHPCDGVMKPNTYDASLTCSACQFQVADESEYAALVAGRQAAIDDETQNPWKAAIIDELIVDCIYSKEHESDPRRALAEAIAWNVKVALDPTVSKEARDMQQAAIDAALENIEDALNAEGRYDSADLVRSRKGTNPLAERAAEYARGIEFRVGQLAERDARIAELERELAEARIAARAEREACAAICDSLSVNGIKADPTGWCGEAIRQGKSNEHKHK